MQLGHLGSQSVLNFCFWKKEMCCTHGCGFRYIESFTVVLWSYNTASILTSFHHLFAVSHVMYCIIFAKTLFPN